MNLSCPSCGALIDLIASVEDTDARRFFGQLQQLPAELVSPLIRYLGLFRPVKQRLRWSRMVTIVAELTPLIQSNQVKHNHARYNVPHAAWIQSMNSMVDTPSPSMKLPLKSNGYLFAIIAGQCEKAAAAKEAKAIETQRNRGSDSTKEGMKSVRETLGRNRIVNT